MPALVFQEKEKTTMELKKKEKKNRMNHKRRRFQQSEYNLKIIIKRNKNQFTGIKIYV